MHAHVTYSCAPMQHIHARACDIFIHVHTTYSCACIRVLCCIHVHTTYTYVCVYKYIYIHIYTHMHIHIANFDGANVRKILKRSFAQDTGNGECLC